LSAYSFDRIAGKEMIHIRTSRWIRSLVWATLS